jgi:DNA-binding response OmpR family regulator
VRKRFVRAAMAAARHLTFEGFSLDLANEQLLCDCEILGLTPKAFAVLRRLVDGAGKLVTKAELLAAAGWTPTFSEGPLSRKTGVRVDAPGRRLGGVKGNSPILEAGGSA